MQTSTWTYAAGVLQFAFGIIGLTLGWIDQTVALTLIVNGAAVFGITHQNVGLGKALGKAV